MSTLDQALETMRAAGLAVEHVETDGVLHRVPVEGDRRGKRAGWYVLHTHTRDDGRELVVGACGNYKAGTGSVSIALDWRGMGADERERCEARMREARAAAEAETRERAKEAAKRASEIWPTLPSEGTSAYLQAKGVGAYGVRFTKGGGVCVPMRAGSERLRGLQFIQPDGTKRFLTGSSKRGSFHLFGELAADYPIAVCEGYATAASVHMATGWQAACAFDSGNLRHVVLALRKLFADRLIFICADMDDTPGNPGLTAARAAVADDRMVVVPAC